MKLRSMSGTDLSFIYYTIPETWVPATLTQTHVISFTYSLLAIHVPASYKGRSTWRDFFWRGDQPTTAAQKVCKEITHLCALHLHVKCVGKTYTLMCSLIAHLRVRVWIAHWCAVKCVALLHTRDESVRQWPPHIYTPDVLRSINHESRSTQDRTI